MPQPQPQPQHRHLAQAAEAPGSQRQASPPPDVGPAGSPVSRESPAGSEGPATQGVVDLCSPGPAAQAERQAEGEGPSSPQSSSTSQPALSPPQPSSGHQQPALHAEGSERDAAAGRDSEGDAPPLPAVDFLDAGQPPRFCAGLLREVQANWALIEDMAAEAGGLQQEAASMQAEGRELTAAQQAVLEEQEEALQVRCCFILDCANHSGGLIGLARAPAAKACTLKGGLQVH